MALITGGSRGIGEVAFLHVHAALHRHVLVTLMMQGFGHDGIAVKPSYYTCFIFLLTIYCRVSSSTVCSYFYCDGGGMVALITL